jgi:hypothetical protein
MLAIPLTSREEILLSTGTFFTQALSYLYTHVRDTILTKSDSDSLTQSDIGLTNMIKRVVLTALLLTFAGTDLSAQAQSRPRPRDPIYNNRRDNIREEFDNRLKRIESESETFRRSLDRAMDSSSMDGTRQEDQINEVAKELRRNTSEMRDRFRDRRLTRTEIERVLSTGRRMDNIMQRRLSRNSNQGAWRDAMRDWQTLRTDLMQLENIFDKLDRLRTDTDRDGTRRDNNWRR